jgi:hypothetical protein
MSSHTPPDVFLPDELQSIIHSATEVGALSGKDPMLCKSFCSFESFETDSLLMARLDVLLILTDS